MAFSARTRIVLSAPAQVIAEVSEHLGEHGATVEALAGRTVLRFRGSTASLVPEDDAAAIAVEAPTVEALYFIRAAVASHVREFARDPHPVIVWDGDGQELVRPPNFSILTAVSIRDVTPHMRRITFAGDGVHRFASLTDLHVNLLFQPPGCVDPQWPRLGPDGLIAWDRADERPVRRKYTIRSVDLAAGTLDIDFVLHDDAGPGSRFASQAGPGQQVGCIGPGGGGLIDASWYLFAGDETALPAVVRMLEHLPGDASAQVVLSVATRMDIQDLPSSDAIDVRWLVRDEAAPSLAEAVASVAIPRDGSHVFAWAGCEFEDFRAIRHDWRRTKALQKSEHLAVAYWRRGAAEDA